eukprot:191355-Pelagomonas_calceolata.AAC.1
MQVWKIEKKRSDPFGGATTQRGQGLHLNLPLNVGREYLLDRRLPVLPRARLFPEAAFYFDRRGRSRCPPLKSSGQKESVQEQHAE